MIILTLTGKTLSENLDILEKERRHIDLAELRIDLLEERERPLARRFPSLAGIPTILTLRNKNDGGGFTGSVQERTRLLSEGLKGGFSFIDLEDNTDSGPISSLSEAAGTRIIRSFHDFSGVPKPLLPRLEDLSRFPGIIPKAALYPGGIEDFLEMLSAARAWKTGERIILGMGPFGTCSRILLPSLNSAYTYASPSGDGAPGQISPAELTEVYRVRSLTPETRIFGIFGNPIGHTLSPRIHNLGFRETGYPGVYVPFQVDNWEAGLKLAEALNIQGLSVTVPHKEKAAVSCYETEETVKAVGSCNTLVRSGGGFKGFNTDVSGFSLALDNFLAAQGRTRGEGKALVIGAGGAARAVIYSLCQDGYKAALANRSRERGEALAEYFGINFLTLAEAADTRGVFDIIVQTTSAGMEPRTEEDPIPDFPFTGREAVMDLIYKPKKTEFLRRAEEAGCPAENGLAMLAAQGMSQFRLFTGLPYPLSLSETVKRISAYP